MCLEVGVMCNRGMFQRVCFCFSLEFNSIKFIFFIQFLCLMGFGFCVFFLIQFVHVDLV